MVKHDPEPAGGVSPPDGDAPRMNATDTVGLSQTCLFNYSVQRLRLQYMTCCCCCWEPSEVLVVVFLDGAGAGVLTADRFTSTNQLQPKSKP